MITLETISSNVHARQRISAEEALFLYGSNDLLAIGELAALATAVLWTLSSLAWTSAGRYVGALQVSFVRLLITSALLAAKVGAADVLNKGLLDGMEKIGKRFKANEVYIPEVLIAARAMNQSMEILKPELVKAGVKPIGKMLLGTVKGDLHDIGKNLVKMMLEVNGIEVHDLGRDVEMERFIAAVKELDADLLCMSALMTTTIIAIKDYMPEFKAKLPNTKIMIGGAPLNQHLADEWGADGYGESAVEAARVALQLLEAR
jgi:5-methyltetrahydrofolate--homocysteine methyltransferase